MAHGSQKDLTFVIIHQYEKQRLWPCSSLLQLSVYIRGFPESFRYIKQRTYHTAIPDYNARRLEKKTPKVRTVCAALNLEIPSSLTARLHACKHTCRSVHRVHIISMCV